MFLIIVSLLRLSRLEYWRNRNEEIGPIGLIGPIQSQTTWLAFAFAVLAIFLFSPIASAQGTKNLPAAPPPWKAKPTPTPKPKPQEPEVLDVIRTTSNLVMVPVSVTDSMKLLVEPSGAAAAAAVMCRKVPADVKRVGVVLSGGNIDASVLARVIAES